MWVECTAFGIKLLAVEDFVATLSTPIETIPGRHLAVFRCNSSMLPTNFECTSTLIQRRKRRKRKGEGGARISDGFARQATDRDDVKGAREEMHSGQYSVYYEHSSKCKINSTKCRSNSAVLLQAINRIIENLDL